MYNRNELSLDDFKQFCVNFNISNLLLDNDEIQFIYKKLSIKPDSLQKTSIMMNYNDFYNSVIYMCLFSIDYFADTSNLKKDISEDSLSNNIKYYDKICIKKQYLLSKIIIENFFNFLELTHPFNKKEIENYILIQKGLSHKEKNFMLKNKAESLPMSKKDYISNTKTNQNTKKRNSDKGDNSVISDNSIFNK